MDSDTKTNAGLTAWNNMAQREGVTVDLENALKNLMAKMDTQSKPKGFFDAAENLPSGP